MPSSSKPVVVDTSALVAIALREPGYELLADKLLDHGALIAAPNVLELSMVMSRYIDGDVKADVQALLNANHTEPVPFTPEMAERAVEAFLRFGKGRHPARLNFGDCIAYALGKATRRPLLWVGDDFDLTDAKRA